MVSEIFCAEAEELRREYAQSWRDSDVSLGIKKPKRPMVSASAAAAASDLEKTSGSEGACSLKGFDEGLFHIFLCGEHCTVVYKCFVAVVFKSLTAISR